MSCLSPDTHVQEIMIQWWKVAPTENLDHNLISAELQSHLNIQILKIHTLHDEDTFQWTHTCLSHSGWRRQQLEQGWEGFIHSLWNHFGHPWDEQGLSNPSWRHWGFPLWDQAWMRAGCRGPKPGGFRPATSQGSVAVSQNGKRD